LIASNRSYYLRPKPILRIIKTMLDDKDVFVAGREGYEFSKSLRQRKEDLEASKNVAAATRFQHNRKRTAILRGLSNVAARKRPDFCLRLSAAFLQAVPQFDNLKTGYRLSQLR